jgi:hypothetical protein
LKSWPDVLLTLKIEYRNEDMYTFTPLGHLQGMEVRMHLLKHVKLKNALSWSPLAAGEWLTSRGLSL